MANPPLRNSVSTILTAVTAVVAVVGSVLLYNEFEAPPAQREVIYQQIWVPGVAVIALVMLLQRRRAAVLYLGAIGAVGLIITIIIAVNGSAFSGHATVGWWCTVAYALAVTHLAWLRSPRT
jgi:hypothetical protein